MIKILKYILQYKAMLLAGVGYFTQFLHLLLINLGSVEPQSHHSLGFGGGYYSLNRTR